MKFKKIRLFLSASFLFNFILSQSSIEFTDLVMKDSLFISGRLLHANYDGLNQIKFLESKKDTIFIAVHGYRSDGDEWVYALKKMASSRNQTYYFVNDWNKCPSTISMKLEQGLKRLIYKNSEIKHIVIFGHSYGGIVVTNLIDVPFPVSVEIHSIAGPLAGTKKLKILCSNSIKFQEMQMVNSLYEWRTVHKQDGAFKNMQEDPQVIQINNSNIMKLPPVFKNGRRLGHNSSITWVIDEYFKNDK